MRAAMPVYIGVSNNEGHLICTQNGRIPHIRTPKQDSPIYRSSHVQYAVQGLRTCNYLYGCHEHAN